MRYFRTFRGHAALSLLCMIALSGLPMAGGVTWECANGLPCVPGAAAPAKMASDTSCGMPCCRGKMAAMRSCCPAKYQSPASHITRPGTAVSARCVCRRRGIHQQRSVLPQIFRIPIATAPPIIYRLAVASRPLSSMASSPSRGPPSAFLLRVPSLRAPPSA